MFEVSVVMNFSAAHNLRGYKGKCEELHGHNWKVELTLSSLELDNCGMVEDFNIIKKGLSEVLSLFDHHYLNDLVYFKKINPTSENIARLVFQKMKTKFKRKGLSICRVKIWETENSCAVYYE